VLLREGFRWFMERLNDNADAVGEPRLSAAAAIVVSHLQPRGSRPADIARAMGVTRQHVHAVVRELTDAGVVRTVADPVSRRDRLIVPTQEGESRRQRAAARLAALEAEIEESIGPADLERLHHILIRLWSPGGNGVSGRDPGRSDAPDPHA
jgi:DNA-binding MarR family transcriptional regulator